MHSLTSRRWLWAVLTAMGAMAFGSVFWVNQTYLPADMPLWGSALRALPAGLVLLLIVRRLPRGVQWARALLLGSINMGGFFFLVFIAAQLLPSSIAAALGAASPLTIAFFAWVVLRERTRPWVLLMAVLGLGGVLLIVGTNPDGMDWRGVAASVGMLILMSLGAALNKQWSGGVPPLTWTAWQLLVGGLELLIVAALMEGPPPVLDGPALWAVAYLTFVATGFAYFCWFSGFEHLPAATVGVISLLIVITGVIIGVVIGGEPFTTIQLIGILLVVASVLGSQQWRSPGTPSTSTPTPANPSSPLPHAEHMRQR
ncbi:DMT family transporter [Paenarthrobacter sp. NPDC089714]|uniref:DMT family transporter n=1 Tax=Paenarthrobacter sp. NPDC089714 TaxID=3364377 RepID=UPI0037F613B1